MENINIIKHKKFRNSSNYQFVEDKIYNDLTDIDGFSTYRIAVTITIEKEKFSPKVIQQQLESHFIHIEEVVEFEENSMAKYILGGELEDLQEFLRLKNVIYFNKRTLG